MVVQFPERHQHQCRFATRCIQAGGGEACWECLWGIPLVSPDEDDIEPFHGFTDTDIDNAEMRAEG